MMSNRGIIFFTITCIFRITTVFAAPFSQEVDSKIISIKKTSNPDDVTDVINWFTQAIKDDETKKTYSYSTKFNKTHFCEPLSEIIVTLQKTKAITPSKLSNLATALNTLISEFQSPPSNTQKRALEAHSAALSVLIELREKIAPPVVTQPSSSSLTKKGLVKRSTDKEHLQRLLDENYQIYEEIEDLLINLSQDTKLTLDSVEKLFDEYEKRSTELKIMQEVLTEEEQRYSDMLKKAISTLEAELRELVREKERELQALKERVGL